MKIILFSIRCSKDNTSYSIRYGAIDRPEHASHFTKPSFTKKILNLDYFFNSLTLTWNELDVLWKSDNLKIINRKLHFLNFILECSFFYWKCLGCLSPDKISVRSDEFSVFGFLSAMWHFQTLWLFWFKSVRNYCLYVFIWWYHKM